MYIIKHRSRRINGPEHYYTVAGGANFATIEQAVDCLFDLMQDVTRGSL